jgi:hypothetical protein
MDPNTAYVVNRFAWEFPQQQDLQLAISRVLYRLKARRDLIEEPDGRYRMTTEAEQLHWPIEDPLD